MSLKDESVLMLTRSMGAGGTENVVLMLCELLLPRVKKLVVCSDGGCNVEKLARMGVVHCAIPDMENKSPAVILSILRTLNGIVEREKITMIHTHHRMAAFYSRIMRKNRGIIVINTSHNTFSNKRAFTRFALKRAELVACGEKVAENLTGFFGLSDRPIRVIRNAVKPHDKTAPEPDTLKRLREEGCFLVGNIGRLSEQKGFEYFLQAASVVIKKHENARFIVVGDGERRERLERLAGELGLSEKVLFLGYRSDARAIIGALDLVVLSSLWEGLPLTPIEAFAAGRTVVATAVDGTTEIVADGINGFLVPKADGEALADRICRIISDPPLRTGFEKAALETYRREFSYERFSGEYLSLYEELTGE